MGQDTSCGICGKHYQGCQHYQKIHVAKNSHNTLCGRRANEDILYVNENAYDNDDTDPFDYCVKCCQSMGRAPYGSFEPDEELEVYE